MAEYILLIDSNYEEAEGFVRGLEEATASPWEVELYPNNKTYGLRRYLKFFTVALHVVTHPARYSGKTLLCWQQFYGIAIAFFCRLFHLKKRFRLVIMTFIYKPKSGFAGRLFERFVRYAVTSDAVDRILLTTRAEAPRYAETFGLPLSRFGFAHCGSIPHDPAAYDDPALKAQGYYFATGRSNRDYDFLIRAFRGRPETLCIACDVLAPCPEPNIQVEQNLFGEAMLRRMRNARAVLFAFENDQVASGQLTFLTAMDLGVPVIVTQTQGLTDDYLTDGVTGLVVPKEEAALHEADGPAGRRPCLCRPAQRQRRADVPHPVHLLPCRQRSRRTSFRKRGGLNALHQRDRPDLQCSALSGPQHDVPAGADPPGP